MKITTHKFVWRNISIISNIGVNNNYHICQDGNWSITQSKKWKNIHMKCDNYTVQRNNCLLLKQVDKLYLKKKMQDMWSLKKYIKQLITFDVYIAMEKEVFVRIKVPYVKNIISFRNFMLFIFCILAIFIYHCYVVFSNVINHYLSESCLSEDVEYHM